MKPARPWTADATPHQIAAVRRRFEVMRERAMADGAADPWIEFPRWKAAIDALPDLLPSLAIAPEFRVPLFEVLRDAGATIPPRD